MNGPVIITFLKKRPLLTACLGNTVLFTLLLLFTWPVYHTGDDLNIMNNLSGGYHTLPTECLPYFNNSHYFFSLPLNYLFRHHPAVNWFSVLLLLLQYLSGIAVYYLLLCRRDLATATLTYLSVFIVFGTWMFLYLNISTTSTVCGIAGLALIWHYFEQPVRKNALLVSGILIIIAGAMTRLHTLFPALATAAPFFLLLPGIRKKGMAIVVIAGIFLFIWLLFKTQYQYYASHCPEWVQEEEYREAKYANINYYRDTSSIQHTPFQLEAAMLKELILFDTSLPSAQTLNTLARQTRSAMPVNTFLSARTWYWNFINNRLFFYALLLVFTWFYAGKRERYASGAAILIGIGIVAYIQAFRKHPEYLIAGIIYTITYFTVLTGKYTVFTNPYKAIARTFLLLTLLAWGLIRIYKINQHNAASFQEFRQIHQELSSHPDKLFVNTGDGEAFSYFYCFAAPAQYSFENILFLDHPVTARQVALSADFGIMDIKKAPLYDNIYFRGPVQPVLTQYFQRVLQRSVYYSDTIPGFKHSAIRKLIVR